MHWFKRNPIFFTVLVLLGAVFIVEIVLLVQERRNVEEARQTYEDKTREYERLRTHDPSLTRDNLELAREDLERVEENLATIREALGAGAELGDFFGDPPDDTTEAFFDLTAFVDEYRDKARMARPEAETGIQLRADEHFGFSRFRSSGPPEELIEDIYKQRRITGYLLDTLFEAGPRELVSIRREDVAARRDINVPSGNQEDVFTIPEGMSARIPGFVETYGFQMTFIGHTPVLRDFLNRLAAFEMPILVRGVQVFPADGDRNADRRERRVQPQPAGAAEGEQNGAVPIVEPRLSRFVVTVEFIELVSSDDDSGNGAQAQNDL